MLNPHRFHRVLLMAIASSFTVNAARAEDQPSYPQTPPAVGEVKLDAPATVKAGDTFNATLTLVPSRAIDGKRRCFIHVARGRKVFSVTTFPEYTQDALDASTWAVGRAVKIGPIPVSLPADLPGGDYQVIAGVYTEPAVAEIALKVSGPTGPDPIIINTGTFADKFGVPHRWHVNKVHTCFWDGEPYIPVGGMFIPDADFNHFKAQIDMLAHYGVRDIYWNVGSSVMIPHTWGDKSDEQIRNFQRCIDYMDEMGIRYGMQCSGLQAHGWSYENMGGPNVGVRVRELTAEQREKKIASIEITKPEGGELKIEESKLIAFHNKVNDAFYLIRDARTDAMVAHGHADCRKDDRKEKGEHDYVFTIDLGDLPPGDYVVGYTLAQRRDGWNDNMFYWSEDTEKYYEAIRKLYTRVKMGPGFRFFVDVYWNENNFNHSFTPRSDAFRAMHQAYLENRYGTIDKLQAAWAVESAVQIPDFATAANLISLRIVKDKTTGQGWVCLIDVRNNNLVCCRDGVSQFRYDLLDSIGRQVQQFHVRVANVFKAIDEVPVVFKFFSGLDWWQKNDGHIPDGHDGVGMETYGVGEPMLNFMGIPPFAACQDSTKTMWFIATEIGEGNHQDQALDRNKLFGYTSRLGTAYPIWAALFSGGAKGLFTYYMVPSPGCDKIWDEAHTRDPRQFEWMGTFAEIVKHAPKLVDYMPTVYYRFPAVFHPNSGLTYSDPYRDYFNSDTLWFVDPPGKLPNGAWMLPTFTLRPPTDHMLINLENIPATLRYEAEVNAYLKRDQRITWLGFRKDLGRFPAIDQFYSEEFAKDADGIEFQVLKPGPNSKVIARSADGKVWNLIDGKLQMISKSAEVLTGYRPLQLVTDGKDHTYHFQRFMEDVLGVQSLNLGEKLEGITYLAGDERVTVIALAPADAATYQLGEAYPVFRKDDTGNTLPAADLPSVDLKLPLPKGPVSLHYGNGNPIDMASASSGTASGAAKVTLKPDQLELINSQGKYPWAPEGLTFVSHESQATVIVRAPADSAPAIPQGITPTEPAIEAPTVIIEAENFVDTNFNLGVYSSLPELSNDAMLGLASKCPPPAPIGYYATYTFEVPKKDQYAFWVREGYQETSSPARWRIDDEPWHEATNRLIPRGIRLATLYNCLEDERMMFAWYRYAVVNLDAGRHTLTYSIIDRRPTGTDVGLANNTPYGKLLDCFVITAGHAAFTGRHVNVKARGLFGGIGPNLIENASMENDTGGWRGLEWTGDRWKEFELRRDHGWDDPLWWTYRASGEGHLNIPDLMDIGGLQVRQSYVGVRSLRIRAGDKPRQFVAQPVAVRADQHYTFGGWMRVEKLTAPAKLSVQLIDDEGRLVQEIDGEPISGTSLWQPVKPVTLLTPEKKTLQAKLVFSVQGGGIGAAWCDDVFLHLTSAQRAAR